MLNTLSSSSVYQLPSHTQTQKHCCIEKNQRERKKYQKTRGPKETEAFDFGKARTFRDYLETIWSGSSAYETARTECNRSRSSIFTGVTLNGFETRLDPIGRADIGACGPPPIRNTCRSLKLDVFAYGESSFDRP